MDLVVLATADWDNPLWTNKQHLAARWGRWGHRVLYVESLGLRRPTASRRDLVRVLRRLRRLNRLRRAAPGVWVLSPASLPLHRRSWARRANRRWLERLLRRMRKRLGFEAPVLVTYNPLALEFLGGLNWKLVVYHCVDDLVGAPGMPAELIERKERELVSRADLVVASARPLAEARQPHARRVEYLANAADFDHFAAASSPETRIPADLLRLATPRIGFIGAVSTYKLDLGGLLRVFRERVDWQLALVGPVGEGQPDTRVDDLGSLPNVHLLGPRPYERLPGYVKGFDVCLLPNPINRYTRHMFPLKFFEYLASGKPVVMSPLPALEEYWELGYVASPEDPDAFGRAIERALAEPADARVRAERVAAARRHDWERNARQILDWVNELQAM